MNSPFYKLTGDHNCEINGLKMSQNIIAPAAWCLAIMQEKPTTVIEIGTGVGGFSAMLSGAQALHRGNFITIDIGHEQAYPMADTNCLSMQGVDCFSRIPFIQDAIQFTRGKVFVLCDGGNKDKEWNTFAPFLKPGDVIGAHDWINDRIPNFCPNYWSWSEVSEFSLNLSGMAPFMPEWFDKSAWFVRQKV